MIRKYGIGCLLVILSVTPLFAAKLYIRPVIVPASIEMTLVDVAIIQSSNTAERQRLQRLSVKTFSEKPSLVSAETIRKNITESLREEMIIVGGPAVFLPFGLSEEEKTLYQTVIRKLKDRMTTNVNRIEVKIHSSSDTHIPPPFAFQTESRQLTAITIQAEGIEKRIFIEATVTADTIVASRNIPNNTDLTPEYIGYEKRELPLDDLLTILPCNVDITEYASSTYIPAGRMLTNRHVKKPYKVHAGKPVTILHRRGGITLQLNGTAYQSGTVGEIISVKPSHAEQSLKVRVIGNAEVLVETQ